MTERFPCLLKLHSSFSVSQNLGLAKRVGARLLLASTSEVYGGKKEKKKIRALEMQILKSIYRSFDE